MIAIKENKLIQSIELDILKNVASFCEQNNLRYFLAGGTLLGAIRHNGFIPWDDDVDISMPREDYERLIELFPNVGRYRIIHISNSKYYAHPFAKVVDTETILEELGREVVPCKDMGVYIDIFPIDGVKDNSIITKHNFTKNYMYAYHLGYAIPAKKTAPFSFKIKRLIWILRFSIPGRNWHYNRLSKKLRKNVFDSSKFVGSSFGQKGEKEIIEQSCFSDYVLIPFEKMLFRCPIGYDRYLTQMYGDYMQLPPVEERISAHNTKIYWKNDSYGVQQ